MGSSPGGRGADERAAVAALVVDEEAAPPLLPREISFGNSREGGGSGGGGDDETAPSELSTLAPPSALTPRYGLPGYDPDLHRSPNRNVRPSLVRLHPPAASDIHLRLDVIEGSRKVLRLVLWLGLLLVGALLGADVEYIDIMVRKARPSSGKAEVSQNSIVSSAAATVEAFDVDSPSKYAGSGGESIDGAEPERAARSRVDCGGGRAKSSKRGKAEKTKKDAGGQAKASKRGKANKTKTGKDEDDGDDREHDEDEEAPAADIAERGESKAKGEDDELIATATATHRQTAAHGGLALVADDVSYERGPEETTAVPEARDSRPG